MLKETETEETIGFLSHFYYAGISIGKALAPAPPPWLCLCLQYVLIKFQQ